jgi:predicted Zn-dependent protease/tetratricopeptide (TPR) repeat protein
MKHLPILFACALGLIVNAAVCAQETDENALPLLQNSSLLMKEGKNKEAIESFEKCLQYKLSPKHESSVRACLANLYTDTDKDKAFELLKQSRQLDPENAGVLPALGSHYARRRQFDLAKECLNKYLSTDKDGPGATAAHEILDHIAKIESEEVILTKFNKAVDCYNNSKFADAITILEETQKSDHSHKNQETELLAMCHLREGNYKKGIELAQACLEKNPNQPKLVSALAGAYEGMGDLKKARECLKKYLHMEHDKSKTQAAKDRMPVLKKVIKTAGQADGEDYFSVVSKPILTRWSTTQMPLRVYIEPAENVTNYQASFQSCVPHALDIWCKATEGKVSWTMVDDKSKADIEVSYTADPAAVGNSPSHQEAGICHTHVIGRKGAKIAAIKHASVTLLTTDTRGRAYTKEEIDATAAHEIGHALGMREHSADPNDVMFFSATKNVKEGLTERDSKTILYVYKAVVYEDGKVEIPDQKDAS